MASEFNLNKDISGEWYWVLTGANGEPLAESANGYKNREDCLHSIRTTRDLARNAPVWDVSESRHTRIPEKEVT